MSNYKYGMYVKTIAKIKRDIISGLSDTDVKSKWSISDGQLGFIHDVLLKKSYRNIERRVTALENGIEVFTMYNLRIGSQMYSIDSDFGVGTVVEMLKKSNDKRQAFMTKFHSREWPTLCWVNDKGIIKTSPDGIDRKLQRLS